MLHAPESHAISVDGFSSPTPSNGTSRDETKTTCSGAVDALGRYSKTSPMMVVCGYPADLSASTAAEAFSLGTEANMPPAV